MVFFFQVRLQGSIYLTQAFLCFAGCFSLFIWPFWRVLSHLVCSIAWEWLLPVSDGDKRLLRISVIPKDWICETVCYQMQTGLVYTTVLSKLFAHLWFSYTHSLEAKKKPFPCISYLLRLILSGGIMALSSLHVYHVKLQKYCALLCTRKIVYRIIGNNPDFLDDSGTLTSCNEVEKRCFLSLSHYIGRLTSYRNNSMLQCRTAIFCCVAEGCLVRCLGNCILDKLFSTSLTFSCCSLNSTLTFYRHHGKEAYLNYGCFSRMTTLLHPQNVRKITKTTGLLEQC